MVTTRQYLLQNIEAVSAFNLETNENLFAVTDLQEANLVNEQETVYATGKNGIRIGAADRNKASRFTATNGKIDEGVFATQLGSPVETGTYVSRNYKDVLTLDGSAEATLTFKAQGEAGAEIKFAYIRSASGSPGEKLTQDTAAGAGTFAYDPATNKVTFDTALAGSGVIVFYDVKVVGGKKISNEENKFSMTVLAIYDCWFKDPCTDKSYVGRIIYPKAKVSGNFEFSFGSDFSVQSLEFEALSGGCGADGASVLWDIEIFDEEDIEAA